MIAQRAQLSRRTPAPFLTLLLLALAAAPATAQQNLTRPEAQQKLDVLQQEISELQQTLDSARTAYRREQDFLKDLDLKIQGNALALRELARQREEHESELSRLEQERSEYIASLETRKIALGEQIVAAYQLGRESRLKMLLNQDEPDRLGRMMAYYDYISKEQVAQIQELRTALETLDLLQAGIDEQLIALDGVERQQEQESERLMSRRQERSEAALTLAGKIGDDESRLAELQQNRRDLEALLERLDEALAGIPSDIGEYHSAAELRGSLPMPIEGRVMHAFGQARGGGLNWQGWLISAGAGSEVKSVAYGRVAYADWLRGYGLLMIIDHGDGIMSLYGNNESLLFDVGDWVLPGATISTVGAASAGGQGLYFELRNQGRAVDPATWVSR